MITRELLPEDQPQYNVVVNHPLQSWEWGEFRKRQGVRVIRVGKFDGKKIISAYQLTLHQIPKLPYFIGYFPKGPIPDEEMIVSLTKIGQTNGCIFIQLEPNVVNSSQFIVPSSLTPSTRPLFTKYTFHLDLTQTEEQMLANMHPKTRYNIRVAQKHGVTIQEENTDEAFNRYLQLTNETTQRQGFYAHDQSYHRLMWKTLSPPAGGSGQASGIAHLLTARYQGKILVTWILFLFNNVLYYPYGASTSEFKNVMASNLMMWEAIRWGKSHDATLFDLWGTPGPNPKPTDPYFGFHQFKLGYGPKLVEFVGSYDLVLLPLHYQIYKIANNLRWTILKTKANINNLLK